MNSIPSVTLTTSFLRAAYWSIGWQLKERHFNNQRSESARSGQRMAESSAGWSAESRGGVRDQAQEVAGARGGEQQSTETTGAIQPLIPVLPV